MGNRLLDSYHASGTDEKSFINEMTTLANMTSYPLLDASDVYLLSFHKTKEEKSENENEIIRTYYFYKLDRSNLSRFEKHNDGLTDISFKAVLKKGESSAYCDFFEEIIKNSGLLIAYTDKKRKLYYNGVSKYALLTLCKKADLRGERTHEKGLFRDMFIADGILPKYCHEIDSKEARRNDRLISEGIKLVVRHQTGPSTKENATQSGVGVVLGVFSDTYTEDGMQILADLCESINADRTLGTPKFIKWESTTAYASATIEYPDAAEMFQQKYNLPAKMIPGITIMSSDCGMSSLVVNGTYRLDGTSNTVIISEYARKHTGKIKFTDVINSVKEDIFKNFEPYAITVAGLTAKPLGMFDLKTEQGRQRNRYAINIALDNGFKNLSIGRILGQKRTLLVKETMLKNIDEDIPYTYYDIAEMFFHLKEYIRKTDGTSELGKTAEDNLIKELSKVPEIEFKKGQIVYKKNPMEKKLDNKRKNIVNEAVI